MVETRGQPPGRDSLPTTVATIASKDGQFAAVHLGIGHLQGRHGLLQTKRGGIEKERVLMGEG